MIILNGNINNKVALMESQESKSISAAKKLLVLKLNYTPEEADKFVRIDLRNDIPILKTEDGSKFILGCTRMFVNRELNSAAIISKLNKTLKLLVGAHYNEYDRNLNGLSVNDLIARFEIAIKQDSNNEREEMNKMHFQGNSRYNIVPVNTFEDAQPYRKYTEWCITEYKKMFDSYTNGGLKQFYFCLRDDFKTVEKTIGDKCPLDNYGLSMLAVCVDEDGDLSTCTCRWNHSNNGNDNIMTAKEISQVINVNFYEVFKPNMKWQNTLNEINKALKKGLPLMQIFHNVHPLDGGGNNFIVSIKAGEDCKYNVLTSNRQDFLFDKWYDNIEDCAFSKQLILKDYSTEKRALADLNGNIIGNAWFDSIIVRRNFALIYLESKGWNVMSNDGVILSPDMWFSMFSATADMNIFVVRKDDLFNYINTEGKLLSPDMWFDSLELHFNQGNFTIVRKNDKSNILSKKGELKLSKWYDNIIPCYDSIRGLYFEVIDNNKHNFLDSALQIKYNVWFNNCFVVDEEHIFVSFDGSTSYLLKNNGDLYNKGEFIKNIANKQNKEVFITESQMKYLQEMAYPTNFNIEEFKGLTSFAKRVEYCNKRLVFLGQGSSRRVYMVDNEKCLKLAKNRKGIAQNEAENDYCLQQLDLCPTIYNYDRNGLWIEVQIAKKAKASDFKRLTGYGWDVFCAWVDYVATQYLNPKLSRYRGEFREIFESSDFENFLYNNNSIFSKINTYMTDYMLKSYGDLQRLSSWGIVSNNGQENLVLVDSGLNDIVGREHYGFNV